MKKILWILVGLFIISCSGGGGTIEVTGQKNEEGKFYVPADGVSFIELTIKISSGSGDIYDGTEVTISTDKGEFRKDGQTEGVLEVVEKTVNAIVSVKLYSTDTIKGEARVKIKFSDPYDGTSIEKTIMVLFSDLDVGKKLSACNFSILCDRKNIPALKEQNMRVECRVTTQDRYGEHVNVPNLKFLIEGDAAEMVKEGDKFFLEIDATKKPKDVDPLVSSGSFSTSMCGSFGEADSSLQEPCILDPIDGHTRNPRDGLVTIVAYANGEECFRDTNTNGKWDMGEYVEDLGEPYIDANDNGEYDDDEVYADVFQGFVEGAIEGRRDPKDGFFSEDVPIFTYTKVLFTGLYDENLTGFRSQDGSFYTGYTGEATALSCGGSLNYTFEIMDNNMNPLHGKGENDNLIITTSGDTVSAVTLGEKYRDTLGMDINENGLVSFINWKKSVIFPFGVVSRVSDPSECESAIEYQIKAEFNSNSDSNSGLITEAWGIAGPVN